MITVYPLAIFLLAGVCIISGWTYGFSWGRIITPKGTQKLYGDHLKVHELRQYLRGVKFDDLGGIMQQIRRIVGDAEYREF